MKILMKAGGIKRIVFQLDGYLQAVRDMNDDQSGRRYWFWADMLDVKKEPIFVLIDNYLKNLKLFSYEYAIVEIDLDKELSIIEDNKLANYLQGSSNPDDEKQNYIKRLHGWRIQEYISLAANYKKEDGRWATTIINSNEHLTTIFEQIKKHLIVMNFMKKPNSDCLNGS